MTRLHTLIDGIDFGEGPRWHDGKLWYSDFYQHAVFTVESNGVRQKIVTVPGQPSGLGWLPDGDLLIVSMTDRRVLRWNGAELTAFADINSVATFHCNDMVVDRRGNAYVGNFGWDLFTAGMEQLTGASLALVTADGVVTEVAKDLLFPNGAVITSDGSTLIIGETMGARYTAFNIREDGSLADRRVWAELPGCAPDGCALDTAGGIWFADALGNRALRVVEGGEITDTIDVGTGCFACTLGGNDGRTLFLVTAPDSDPARVAGKAGGAILTTEVKYSHAGLP